MKCPGQDSQYWKDDAIFEVNCPECDADVEFYKDDTSRKCPKCGHRFVNPKLDFGCASYCQFAEQCLGTLPEDFAGSREDLLKDKVAVSLKKHLGTDFKAIRRATELARIGEKICKEEGGNLVVVLCGTYLQGIEGGKARLILTEAGADERLTEAVLQLTETDSAVPSATTEAQIISDTIKLRNHKEHNKQQTASSLIEQDLFTGAAKKLLTEGI